MGFVLGSGVGVGFGLGFERVGEVPSLSRVEVRTAALHEPHPKGQHLRTVRVRVRVRVRARARVRVRVRQHLRTV